MQRSDVFVAIAPVQLYQGLRFRITVAAAGTLEEAIGVMWITFGLVAPLLVLSHGYVLYALVERRDEFATSVA